MKLFIGIGIAGLILGLIFGFLIGGLVSTHEQDKLLQQSWQRGYNIGWNELQDNWINSLMGLKESCFYEVNKNKTMVRYVCGDLTNGWRAK